MLLLIKLLGLSGFGSKPNKCKLCFYAQTPPSLPPPTPPYTGGELITKRFALLCKEGLGEVVDAEPPSSYSSFSLYMRG